MEGAWNTFPLSSSYVLSSELQLLYEAEDVCATFKTYIYILREAFP